MSEKNKPNGVVGPLVSRPVDEERNRLILADVERVLNEGRSPLALTQRKDHVELLVTQARALTPHVIALQGGRTPRQRVALAEQMAA
ncbi:MAG: hypothetical protein FJZ01_27635, partial [Candidatus Sericytochromatia bacterium]|nr:hypothetical protein [Candidatus Tanganyikabacteria bacterium]